MKRLVLALALVACGSDRAPPSPEPHHDEHDDHDDAPGIVHIAPEMVRDLRITTAAAEARTAGERSTVPGELAVNQDAYAEIAAPLPARVAAVLVRAGDVVVAGQPLIELHSPELGRARAEAGAATSRVALARRTAERKRALVADRLIAEREAEGAEAALADAEAAAQIAGATLRALGDARGDHITLRSPIAGTVIDRDVVLGQLADPSHTLFRIGDLSTLWLVAHVFERDALRVRVGAIGTARFAARPGATVPAVVTWIGGAVDPGSRTLPVRLDVRNPDELLRPGMSASVSLPLGDDGATVVAVPAAAVQRVGAGWAVFTPQDDASFTIRPIGRGRDLGGEVEVTSGLAPGDLVVVDGAFLLKAEADKARGEGGHEH